MSMFRESFGQHRAAPVKVAMNVFSIFDALTGEWHQGPDGEYYCVGGLYHNTAFAGGPNVGKTQIALHFFATAMSRYYTSEGHVADTEGTCPASRINRVAKAIRDGILFTVFDEHDPDNSNARCDLLDGTTMFINEWFDTMLKLADERTKKRQNKKDRVTLPWRAANNGITYVLPAYISMVDSWTEARIEGAEELATNKGVDDSSGNTEYMYDGRVKGRILSQSPKLQVKGDIFCIYTASVDEKIEMGGMPGQAPKKQMAYMDGGLSLKKVSNQFKKMTTSIWWFRMPKPLYKGTATADKVPKYPYDKDDVFVGNTDLEYVIFSNTRGKNGGSGVTYELVKSQRDGIKPGLSELNHCIEWGSKDQGLKWYGISDAGQYQYTMDLMPDVKWRNTTIRKMLDDDAKLRRAVELTAWMKLEFYAVQEPLALELKCTPKELYDDIKALGYDWDILLDTRGYWLYEELAKGQKPFLSIMDLLRMRKGLYHPKWYTAPLKK